MTRSPTVILVEAADHVSSLVKSCQKAGLEAEVIERSSKVRVSSPHAHSRLAETITLRPDENGLLMWHWSWDEAICPGQDSETAVKALRRVVTVEGR